jgi:hypothetical protein
MAKSEQKEIELYPDAMRRFERAVKVVAKSPLQHRVKPKVKSKRAASPERTARKSQTKKV